MQLEAPLYAGQEPSEAQLEREGEDFMAFMGMANSGAF